LGFAAINTANNLIYLIVSALLSFMGLSGFLGRRNIQDLEVILETPEESYDSIPFVSVVRLINKKRFMPSFLIRCNILNYKVFFPFIDNNTSTVAYTEMRFKGRGKHKIDRIYVCSVFPFNFFVRCKSLSQPLEVLIFPAPLVCDSGYFDISEEKQHRGEVNSDKPGFDSDMISIRNYIPGDPFKLINWKATAKTGNLKTKELSSLLYEPVIIDLKDIPFDLEKKLSCAVFMINSLYKQGIPFGLRIDDKLFPPECSQSHKIRLLRELALYGSQNQR